MNRIAGTVQHGLLKKSFMSRRPLILVDFDQTLTQQDTIATLGQFALDQHPKAEVDWSYFTERYLTDYNAFKTSPPDAWPDWLDYLNRFRSVEAASLDRINQARVFQYVTPQQLYQHAKTSSQDLQQDSIETLIPYRAQLRIVSLNWSKDWIAGYLSPLELDSRQIWSNEIDRQGRVVPRILTSGDKINVIEQECVKNYIYVGDSIGDVQPLVKANIGIIIGKNKTLIDSLIKFGYKIQEDVQVKSQLYRVDHWKQIKHILDLYYEQL